MTTIQTQLDEREPVRRPSMPEAIMAIVASEFMLNPGLLMAQTKAANIAWPRQLSMYFMRHYCMMSTKAIGEAFNREHTTVTHACQLIEKMLTNDPQRSQQIKRLTVEIEKEIQRRS